MTTVYLDANKLDLTGCLAWLNFLNVLQQYSDNSLSLVINQADHIIDDGPALIRCLYKFGDNSAVSVSSGVVRPNINDSFALISDSRVLSVKLLRSFSSLFICPRSVPREINPGLYWLLLAQPDLQQRAYELSRSVGFKQLKSEPSWINELVLSPRRVSLISSVFNGDSELPSFLENISGLDGYEGDEHLLIRAGSPGHEHEKLVKHVFSNPSSIYVNLVQDPGLYATWNLGARLANGRYLSNANLDDRRAPQQLTLLTSELETNPDVAAVSTALRISEDPLMRWQNSSNLPLMFGDVASQNYGLPELFKKTPEGIKSRNLPHCMPVWRRTLHGKFGWFDESLYGPSADWEFWLRCSGGGERFSFLSHPLGLYRKSPNSYWHRDPRTNNYDRLIVSRYFPQVDGPGCSNVEHLHLLADTRFRELEENWSSGAAYEAMCCLIWLSFWINGRGSLGVAQNRLDNFVKQKLHIRCFCEFNLARRVHYQGGCIKTEQVLWLTVELVHAIPVGTHSDNDQDPDWQLLSCACDDLEQNLLEPTASLARALILRRQGRLDCERALLRALYLKLGSAQFWQHIQRAYRFTVSLQELTAIVGLCRGTSTSNRKMPDRLWTFPYYRSNAYQDLIYDPLKRAGCNVSGIDANKLNDLDKLPKQVGGHQVLHLHWLNAMFKGVVANGYLSRIMLVQQTLKCVREQGIQIWWTVHNVVSHDCVNSADEIWFRRWLAKFVDRLFVHHPLAVDLLDWLPFDAKPELWEHPLYPVRALSLERRNIIRRSVRVCDSEQLVIAFGKMRRYKGVAQYLPPLVKAIQSSSRYKLLIVGEVEDPDVRTYLDEIGDLGRIIIETRRVSDEELNGYLQAADIGVLFYRDVLTSGSLFHMLSAGLEVWAPQLGTLPAEIVPGFNGRIYSTPVELASFVLG